MKRLFGLTILSAGFRLVSLIITVALLAGCQASAAATAPVSTQPPTFEELVHQFDYDPQVALAVIEKGMVEQDGIKVHDLSYVIPSGERVEAYLVMPPGSGPFPGIISLGSQGEDRSQFLGQAKILAKTGIASLIITASFDPIGKERDHDQFIQAIIKLRRAVDLLAARPEVDPKRLGFIGFGDSADMGAVLAGVEKRLKAYVLMAGGARVHTHQANKAGNSNSWSTSNSNTSRQAKARA